MREVALREPKLFMKFRTMRPHTDTIFSPAPAVLPGSLFALTPKTGAARVLEFFTIADQ
jgi:hypothetical protein